LLGVLVSLLLVNIFNHIKTVRLLHIKSHTVNSGLGTALLLFSGHEIYQISGHFQDTKTMFQANILSRCGTHVIKKVEQLQVASYLSMLFHLPSTVKFLTLPR